MKHLAPTLVALAAVAPAFGAVADDLQVKIKGVIQARADLMASATDNRGKDQDFFASNAANGSESEAARFGIRRMRIGFDAKNSTGFFANVTIRADTLSTSGTAGSSQPLNIYYAYAGKTFRLDEQEHEVRLGLDKSFNNESSISSSMGLMAGERPVANIINSQREAGLGYKFALPYLRAGVDVQNSMNLARNANEPSTIGNQTQPNTGNYGEKTGVATSFRIEGSPLGADGMPAKKMESWAGNPGTHLVVGFDFQKSGKTYAVSNEERDFTCAGPDVLFHMDGLTFLAEYRLTALHREATTGSLTPDQKSSIIGKHWDAQAGYAIPMEMGFVIEPALRFSVLDYDRDADERSQWGANGSRDNNSTVPTAMLSQANLSNAAIEGGTTNLGSGSQFEFGVNLYWNGHANKTQIDFQSWKAEKGDSAAKAVVVQHQVTF